MQQEETHTMIQNPTVILSGAGSVIPWKAQSTWDITEVLLKDRTFRSFTGQPIGDWIYHKLIGLYHKDKQSVSFETILNSLEYLITFFSSKHRESTAKHKNLMPAFFDDKDDIWEILWFDRIYERKNDSWHSDSPQYEFYSSWKDYDLFFENVYRLFINIIIKQIEKYSKQSNDNLELNQNLNNFLLSLKSPIRFYTTNYDRIIPTIFSGEMFEGFSLINGELKFDFEKVFNGDKINTYFNLHGSVHFDLDWPENVKYQPDKFICNFGKGASDKKDQDSKALINSNIITGFNKPSRILTNPYSQLYHRFYQDCLNADTIFIIGYSLGDKHLNSAIKTASTINKDIRIVIVDYMVYDEDINVIADHDWINLKDSRRKFLSSRYAYKLNEILTKNNEDSLRIYRKGFELYLTCRGWERK